MFCKAFFLEGVLSQLINHLPLSGGGQSYIFLMEWVVAPIIAIVYAVILKIGVKNYWKGSSFVNCFVWSKKLIQ